MDRIPLTARIDRGALSTALYLVDQHGQHSTENLWWGSEDDVDMLHTADVRLTNRGYRRTGVWAPGRNQNPLSAHWDTTVETTTVCVHLQLGEYAATLTGVGEPHLIGYDNEHPDPRRIAGRTLAELGWAITGVWTPTADGWDALVRDARPSAAHVEAPVLTHA